MRSEVKRLVKYGAGTVSVAMRPLVRQAGPFAVVFNFHRVANVRSYSTTDAWNVPPAVFERQIRFLNDVAEVVRLDSLLSPGAPASRPRCAITFDDGYACVVNNALPILAKLQTPATMFLVTDVIGSHSPMPFDRWSLRAGEQYLDETRPVSRREVETAISSGVLDLGSHSAAHRNARLCTDQELADEAHRSMEFIRSQFGVTPAAYAYPYGSVRRGCVPVAYRNAVREAGYKSAFTTERSVVLPTTDPYLIPRVEVTEDDTNTILRAKLEGSLVGFRALDRLIHR